MSALMWLAPMSVLLGLIGLAAFIWTFAAGQYDDPQGDAARILLDDDDSPPPVPTITTGGEPADAG
jgi:cbb3-type cytochrome oxidase maturation protein